MTEPRTALAQDEDPLGHLEAEMLRVQAISRLAFARKLHPDLNRAENDARVNLAAAILALDETQEKADAHNAAGAEFSMHTLNEQSAVESAILAYSQALAALVRGEN